MVGRPKDPAPVDVSVIILSHREGMLPDALRSAQAQTHARTEVIVKFCRAGWPEKLNEAVAAAAGAYIVLLCDDDVIHPMFVATCLQFAESERADIVYTDRRIFTNAIPFAQGFVSRYHPSMPEGGVYQPTLDYSTFIFGSPLPMTCLIRRTRWARTKGYDGAMPHADTEWWFRAVRQRAKLVYVAAPLFGYRVHPDQLSMTLDSRPDAFQAFHAKHRKTFGIRLTGARDADGNFTGTIRPPWRKRLAAALMRVIAWTIASATPEVSHVRD